MPCAALPSGVTGIISLVFGIMFWVQYGNVKDTCEGEGSEDFDKISKVFTLAIINFCYCTVHISTSVAVGLRQAREQAREQAVRDRAYKLRNGPGGLKRAIESGQLGA